MTRCLLLIALLGGVSLGTPDRARAEDSSVCGPFVTASAAAAGAATPSVDESGITAGQGGSSSLGSIVPIPAAVPVSKTSASDEESEAILALPKDEAGQIPDDFELGPGASIRDSFFSPVICATVARVAGPPGATLAQLVTVVPEGSALVANDVYASASSEVRPVEEAEVETADPYLGLQYGLAVTGVRAARELSTGEGVKIALLDSAPETTHRDLSSDRILPPPPAAEEEGAPEPPVGVHGTLMAGVINAIADNGFGIAGLAPGAELISIPICRPTAGAGGTCTIYDILRGLDQAWNAEASIVNLSLSGPPNILFERGVARLEELGVVVVAAAGNEGTRDKRYPAAYPSVVSVGAIDRDGALFSGSNRGPWVELGAPGADVLSTVPGSAFAFGNGTSLAAAHVSGALAVLTSVTVDPKIARRELFRASGPAIGGNPRPLPTVCDVFARLGHDCAAKAPPPAN